jgi:hypothetical protein
MAEARCPWTDPVVSWWGPLDRPMRFSLDGVPGQTHCDAPWGPWTGSFRCSSGWGPSTDPLRDTEMAEARGPWTDPVAHWWGPWTGPLRCSSGWGPWTGPLRGTVEPLDRPIEMLVWMGSLKGPTVVLVCMGSLDRPIARHRRLRRGARGLIRDPGADTRPSWTGPFLLMVPWHFPRRASAGIAAACCCYHVFYMCIYIYIYIYVYAARRQRSSSGSSSSRGSSSWRDWPLPKGPTWVCRRPVRASFEGRNRPTTNDACCAAAPATRPVMGLGTSGDAEACMAWTL